MSNTACKNCKNKGKDHGDLSKKIGKINTQIDRKSSPQNGQKTLKMCSFFVKFI